MIRVTLATRKSLILRAWVHLGTFGPGYLLGTENPRVGGSIPSHATIFNTLRRFGVSGKQRLGM